MTRSIGGVVAVAVAVLAGCAGGDADDVRAEGTDEHAATEFCTAWAAALRADDVDAGLNDALAVAPPEISDEAQLLRRAPRGEASPETDRASAVVVDFANRTCSVTGDHRVAPPADADLGDVERCGTGGVALPPEEGRSAVLYGIDDGDAYDGPMIGVLWNPTVEGDATHRGDGDAVPVTVRGVRGAVAEITVFQQVVLPELGSVVAWEEDSLGVGLYARGWSLDDVGELVALADALVRTDDGGFELPSTARPEGFVEVSRGPLLHAVFPQPLLYQVRYQTSDGASIQLTGVDAGPDQLETLRFLAVDVHRATVHGRDAIVGDLWARGGGPAVVAWHDGEIGVVVVGTGADVTAVRDVAERARLLSTEEWHSLVTTQDDCANAVVSSEIGPTEMPTTSLP